MANNNRLEIIWGTAILDEGFTSIPNILIRNYRHIGVEHGEWGLICAILTFKHDHRDPYPSQSALASIMNCSERQIKKWVESLRTKGLIRVGQKYNEDGTFHNNLYNFKPLIDKCLELIGEKPLPDREIQRVRWMDEPGVPEVPTDKNQPSVPEVPTVGSTGSHGTGPEVPPKKKSIKNKKNEKENKKSQSVKELSRSLENTISADPKLTDRRTEIVQAYLSVKNDKNYSDALFIATMQKAVKAKIKVPFGQYLLKAMIKNMSELKQQITHNDSKGLPEYIVTQLNQAKKEAAAAKEELDDEQKKIAQDLLHKLGFQESTLSDLL